jgi:hypothetical protein
MSGAIPPLPNTPSWCGAQLKHSENFTFIIIISIIIIIIIIAIIIKLSGNQAFVEPILPQKFHNIVSSAVILSYLFKSMCTLSLIWASIYRRCKPTCFCGSKTVLN